MRKFVGALLFILLFPAFFSHTGIGSGDLGLWPWHGEPKIFGRIAESRETGVFSHALLTGWCGGDAQKYKQDFQLKNFKGVVCSDYIVYTSQTGGQAFVFSLLDNLSLSETQLRLLVAAFLAYALALFCLWLYDKFGIFTAMATAVGILAMRSLVLVGDNVAHIFGVYFLILACLCFAYEKRAKYFGTLVFSLMLLKYILTGFEYITTAWMLAFVPLAFYAIAEKFPRKVFLTYIGRTVAGIVVATLIAGGTLFLQISAISSPQEAYSHITTRMLANSQFPVSGSAIYFKSMEIGTPTLFMKYLSFDALHFSKVRISFTDILIFFAIITIAALGVYKKNLDRRLPALVTMLWISSIAPLTWPLLFKGHAAFHVFIDPVIWHIPFTIIGTALTAITCTSLFELFKRND